MQSVFTLCIFFCSVKLLRLGYLIHVERVSHHLADIGNLSLDYQCIADCRALDCAFLLVGLEVTLYTGNREFIIT